MISFVSQHKKTAFQHFNTLSSELHTRRLPALHVTVGYSLYKDKFPTPFQSGTIKQATIQVARGLSPSKFASYWAH